MNLLDAILLGLVQGLAEFLPISSSGHLVLVENLLGAHQTGVAFDVFLHFSTLLVVFIYFRKDILSIKLKELKLIAIASIPAVTIGLLFRHQLEAMFGSVLAVSLLLIITGIINLVTDRKLEKTKKNHDANKEITLKSAFIIGLFQAFAILPGISRSGSTVAGGILQNIDRKKAFRFSFLMVIPVILGASGLQLLDVLSSGLGDINIIALFVGGATAFISGFLSLRVFEYVIKKARLKVFGYYCIALGLLSIGFGFF